MPEQKQPTRPMDDFAWLERNNDENVWRVPDHIKERNKDKAVFPRAPKWQTPYDWAIKLEDY